MKIKIPNKSWFTVPFN